MLVWIETVSPSEFEVCLRESRVFDGLHERLKVVSQCVHTWHFLHFFSFLALFF